MENKIEKAQEIKRLESLKKFKETIHNIKKQYEKGNAK